MSLPLAVLQYTTDGGGKVELVGCGEDYVLLAVRKDCPDCISHPNAIDKLAAMLGPNVGVVIMPLMGTCLVGLTTPNDGYRPGQWTHKNVLYLDNNDAAKIFPPVDDKWWETQRRHPRAPKTFQEVCAIFEKLANRAQKPQTDETTQTESTSTSSKSNLSGERTYMEKMIDESLESGDFFRH